MPNALGEPIAKERMGSALLITLREGIEAALIVSILLAYLQQLGRGDKRLLVLWGTVAAIVVSILAGGIVYALAGEFEGKAEETYEGVVTLLAVSVLTWMIFWMRRQGARVKSELQHRVDSALVGGGLALGGLAFVAVLREGIETALFLFGADKAAGVGYASTLTGGIIGLAIAAVLGYLLYRGGIRLNLRTFFRVTGMLIIVVAAGLFAFSLHELQEAGYLPLLTSTAYDVSGVLADDSGIGGMLRALVGYNDDPTWLEVVAWFGYLTTSLILFLRPIRALPGSDSPRLPAPTSRIAQP